MCREWKVNQRVWVVGYGFNGKIVAVTGDGIYPKSYYVREFNHPHSMVWVYGQDLYPPRGKNHDKKWVVPQDQRVGAP